LSGEEEHTNPLLEMEELSGEIPPEPVSIVTEIKMSLRLAQAILQAIGKKENEDGGSEDPEE
jgi:hypothetical protein